MDSLHSWKTRFRKTFDWKNTRNGQNHARRRLPWEAFETTSYNRNLHLVTIVNDNISDTKTIHGPKKTLQIPQKKMNPFQVCPRKMVKTHARKNVRRDVFAVGWLAKWHFDRRPADRPKHLIIALERGYDALARFLEDSDQPEPATKRSRQWKRLQGTCSISRGEWWPTRHDHLAWRVEKTLTPSEGNQWIQWEWSGLACFGGNVVKLKTQNDLWYGTWSKVAILGINSSHL